MYDFTQQVLSQYDVNVVRTYKGRGSTICVTDSEILQLKQLDTSNSHIYFEHELKNNIMNAEHVKVDQYVKNIDNELISEDKRGDKYVLKKWFEGNELDFKNVNDVYRGASNLGKIHKSMCVESKVKMSGCSNKDIYDEYVRHNQELKRVRDYIRRQSTKTEFEQVFLKHFDGFHKLADEAIHKLEDSNYIEIKMNAMEKGLIRHGNYNQHNILNIKGQLATVNFEHAHCGIQVIDLYNMLRKVMEKNDWDVVLGKNIIRSYDQEKELSQDELDILKIMLIYPEKFWKIANQYSHMKRGMLPKRYIDKLNAIIQQQDLKMKFIEELSHHP